MFLLKIFNSIFKTCLSEKYGQAIGGLSGFLFLHISRSSTPNVYLDVINKLWREKKIQSGRQERSFASKYFTPIRNSSKESSS